MRCDVAVKCYVGVRAQLSNTPHFTGEKTEAQKAEVTGSPSKSAPRPDERRSPSSGPWHFLYLPASAPPFWTVTGSYPPSTKCILHFPSLCAL